MSAKDPKSLFAWYKKHLGIDVQDWGGTAFTWTDSGGNPTKGTTIWSVGSAEGNHFAPSKSTFMVNYRVEEGNKVELWQPARRAIKFSRRLERPTSNPSLNRTLNIRLRRLSVASCEECPLWAASGLF